jgi:hypothetical protein
MSAVLFNLDSLMFVMDVWTSESELVVLKIALKYLSKISLKSTIEFLSSCMYYSDTSALILETGSNKHSDR